MEMEILADVVANTYSFVIKVNNNNYFTVEKSKIIKDDNERGTETTIIEFFPIERVELKLITMYLSVLMETQEIKKVKTAKELRNFISEYYKR